MQRRDLLKYLTGLPLGATLAGSAPWSLAHGGSGFQGMNEICPMLAEELINRHINQDGMVGLPTGYRQLDRRTHGLRKGELIVIASRPSMGKTTLALNISENIVLCPTAPRPVGFFSMEMATQELTMRMVASLSRTSLSSLRRGYLEAGDWARVATATKILSEAPLYIDDTPALTIAELTDRARQLKQQHPDLGLIVIDYLQLMQSNHARANQATDLAAISRSLKSLAQELEVPFVILSQLGRDIEQRPDKRPVISDLRNLTHIKQDADLILFIYRDELYNQESSRTGEADILIARNRYGETGSFVLSFEGRHARFQNYIPNFSIPT
jgi:replicative DNA helicase